MHWKLLDLMRDIFDHFPHIKWQTLHHITIFSTIGVDWALTFGNFEKNSTAESSSSPLESTNTAPLVFTRSKLKKSFYFSFQEGEVNSEHSYCIYVYIDLTKNLTAVVVGWIISSPESRLLNKIWVSFNRDDGVYKKSNYKKKA